MRFERREGRIQAPKAPGQGLSLLVFAAGMVVTMLIALLQVSNARTERQIMFDAASARVQQNLVDTVDTKVQEFQSARNFIAATHPGPLDEYQAFFSREVEAVIEMDPGILFLETIPEQEIDQLRAREEALGNDIDFVLLPAQTEQRAVITRSVRPTSVFGRPLLGFDVTL